MNKLDDIRIKQSECRERGRALLALETRTAEQETELRELTPKAQALEVEYRAAVVSEPEPDEGRPVAGDTETRERDALARGACVGSVIAAAINGKPLEGREAELHAAHKLSGGHVIPLSMFDVDRPQALETRAVTPGVTAVQQAAPTTPFAFQRSAVASLGFQFPMVASGQANYPVVTTAAPAGSVDKGAAALATAGAFRLDTRLPKRVAGSFDVRIEDVAVFPDMERSLRESLMDSMSNALDKGCFTGDNASGALNGLFEQSTAVAGAGTTETFVTGIKRLAALVDGQYAYGWSDLRVVAGSDTFAAYEALFNNSLKGDISLWDYLSMKLGSLRVSNRVPDKAADGQKMLVTLNAPMVPLRIPTWMGVEIIVDPYTQAGKGIKVCTATMLVGDPHVPYGVSQLKEVHPKIS